ncbi:MAG: hypothetical protein ACE15B_06900 [Bryobacteraceae bacterium]
MLYKKNAPIPIASATVLSEPLQAAADRVDEKVNERRHVDEVIAATEKALNEARQEAADVRGQMAQAESAAALGGGEGDRALRRRHATCRDAVEVIEARLEGLHQKRLEALQAENRAHRDLAREYDAWRREQCSVIRADMEQAVRRCVAELTRLYAAATAVGDSRTTGTIGNMQVYLPGEQRNLCNRQRLNWKSDPAAMEVYTKLSNVRAAIIPKLAELADAPPPMERTDDAA